MIFDAVSNTIAEGSRRIIYHQPMFIRYNGKFGINFHNLITNKLNTSAVITLVR